MGEGGLLPHGLLGSSRGEVASKSAGMRRARLRGVSHRRTARARVGVVVDIGQGGGRRM